MSVLFIYLRKSEHPSKMNFQGDMWKSELCFWKNVAQLGKQYTGTLPEERLVHNINGHIVAMHDRWGKHVAQK